MQAYEGQFTMEARNVLRRALAASANRKVPQVAIEGVQRRSKSAPGVKVMLTVAMGADVLGAQSLVTQLQV